MFRRVIRSVLFLFGSRILAVQGNETLRHVSGPLIIAANHTQRLEALVLPALISVVRGGEGIRFLADWNFLAVPVLGHILRTGEPIPVVRKSFRPRWLNFLKKRFRHEAPPFEQARAHLGRGGLVGIFPEATAHRRPDILLRGHSGAARLSLETGVPILPIGLRFPGHRGSGPVSDLEPFEVHVGQPLVPQQRDIDPESVAEWHAQLMTSLSRLSGKSWQPNHPRTQREAH
jgi:1-acyl-sn-glycerol-3-phosphate acyltransferase